MLSKRYILFMGTILGLFLVFIGYTNVQAQNQIITPDPTVKTVAPNKEFTFSVKYEVSDGNNTLTGIGIRIHYDSSILEYVEISNVFDEKGSPNITGSPQDDTGNCDNDYNTDQILIIFWSSSNWPGEDLPLALFDIKFKAKDVTPPVDTSINFSAAGTATGYGFDSTSIEVKIRAGTTGEPDITVTPTNLDFGNIIIGNISAKEVTIKNDGNADLSITDISITGSNEFSQTNDCPSELSPDSSCTIDVEFSPTSEGDKSGTLKITSDDPDNGEVDVVLTGKGVLSGEGFQSITPEPTSINAVPGDEFTFSIKYDASSNALAGIGFYIHYSSSFLDFIEVSDVFQKGYLSLIGPEDDIGDKDGDPITDKRFVVSWEDFTPPPSWPGSKLPLSLMDITFHVKGWICPPFDTPINFSVKDTAQGYAFLSTPMELHIVSFHLDIDDNGKVEALTDGLLVIRYLFGFTGEDLVDGTIGSGANRDDPDEIAYWIETGIFEGHLDIDDNGAVTPLTDGLLVVRYLFGFTGGDLVMGATDPNGGRTGSDEIVDYIENYLMPN